ncbi:unnamed protein product [Auanema sp. JU1783]|nr:unnamed protein product [Auanema sp. JU1783]
MEAEKDKSPCKEEKTDVEEASTTLQSGSIAKEDDKKESQTQEDIKLDTKEESKPCEVDRKSSATHDPVEESSSQSYDNNVNKEQSLDGDIEKRIADVSLDSDQQQQDHDAALDDDEIEENPAYIPKKGRYYMHDSRDDGESELTSLKKSRADGDWKHDRFDEKYQRPKSKQQLLHKYGFDIRKKEGECSGEEKEEPEEEEVAPARRNGRNHRGRNTRGKPADNQPREFNGSSNEDSTNVERQRRSDSFQKSERYNRQKERTESDGEEQAFQRRQKPQQTKVVRNVRGARGFRGRGGRNGPSFRGGRQFEDREEEHFESGEDNDFHRDRERRRNIDSDRRHNIDSDRRHNVDSDRRQNIERRHHDDDRRFVDPRQLDDDKRNRKPKYPEYENHRRGAIRGSVRGGSLRTSGRGFSRTFTNKADESRREHAEGSENQRVFERKPRGSFVPRGSRGQEPRSRGAPVRGGHPVRAAVNHVPRGGPPTSGPKRYSQQRSEVFHGQRNEDVVYFDPAVQTKRQPAPPREKKIIEILPPSS